MAESYVKKNGLLYSEDLRTVIGIDSESNLFNGRIPYGAHEILDEAFAGCTYQSISLPDSIKVLPPCLFENLTSLKSVKLPSNLEVFSPYLFSGCSSLDKVTMPDTEAAFAEGLFYGCSSLMEIPFIAGIQELPENVFAGCSSIQSLIIPNSVVKICSRAVADCKSLSTVVLPAKLYDLAEDAFEGCENIRSIRIDPDNHFFYINEDDGCLYERSIEGDDKLRIKIVTRPQSGASLINENIDDNFIDTNDSLFVSEDEFEEDDTFSAEIEATEEEMGSVVEMESAEVKTDNIENQETGDTKMENEDLDAMFADIMKGEKERNEISSDVSVSDDESKVLSEMMAVMADAKPASSGGAVSQDELEKLFASNEAEATADNSLEQQLEDGCLDSKTQILVDSVKFSKIIDCEPTGQSPAESDLLVIAERTVVDEAGNDAFSAKLTACVQKIAKTQDMKRIIMLYGLPIDNDEFMQFFFHYIGLKNVVVACTASSPANLSEYCKTVCDNSRISLEKKDLIEQRKAISIKNDNLIKMIVQDIY